MPFSGSGTGIQNADDVFFSSLSDGETLVYDSGTAKWNNAVSVGGSGLEGYFNVKDYGAVGDDTNDDTAEIQAALTAGAGAVVYFPEGTYKISSALTVSAGTTITGAGIIHQITAGAKGLVITGDGVTIENIKLKGLRQTLAYNATEYAIDATGASAASPIYDVTVSNVEIFDWGRYAVHLKWAEQFVVRDCHLHDLPYAGIMVLSGKWGEISGNRIDYLPLVSGVVNTYGVALSQSGGSLAVDPPTTDVIVRGNRVSRVEWEALDTHGGERLTFSDNIVLDCNDNIAIVAGTNQAARDIVITGNMIDSGTSSEGSLPTRSNPVIVFGESYDKAKNVTITNNIFRRTRTMSLQHTEGVRVTGNSFYEPNRYAVMIQGFNKDLLIKDNTITDVWSDSANSACFGVSSDGTNSVIIDGNVLTTGSKSATFLRQYGIRTLGSPAATTVQLTNNDFAEVTSGIVSGTDVTVTPTSMVNSAKPSGVTAVAALESLGLGSSLIPEGGSAHTIEDEGTPLTARSKLNFVGSGVSVTDDAGDDASVVTISAAGGGSLAGFYDVIADGNCAGNGTTDDTTNFAAAVVAAKAAGMALYVPPTATIRLTSQVDMRGNYDIASYGRLFIDQTSTPGILIGHNANNAMTRTLYLRQVDHASDSTTMPAIRVVGLKNAGHVEIHDTDYLQLWADGDVSADSSVAYNSFQLGACNKLHITSVGTLGWINENSFYGGRISTVLIDGLYAHNHNLFYNPQIEGASSSITLNRGTSNHFYNVRAEGGTAVTFATGTSLNSVEESWVGTPNSALSPAIIVNDAGTLNRVETTDMKSMHRFPFVAIAPGTPMSFKATQGTTENRLGAADVFTDTGTSITVPSWKALIDTGLVPIRRASSTFGSAYVSAPMFQVLSDTAWFRCYAVGYNSAGVKITTEWAVSSNSWVWDGTTDFRWELASANQSFAHMIVTDPNVAFVRLLIDSGGTPPAFTRLAVEFLYNDASMTADLAACAARTLDNSAVAGGAVNTVVTSGPAETLPATVSQHSVTMDEDCTFSFSNPATNGHAFILLLSGPYSPTWPATVKWTGGTEPIYSTPSEYRFATYDGGVSWLGAQVGAAFA